MDYAVTIDEAVKNFGPTKAVDRVDLQVPQHSVYALLGPNGAGKTTLVRMIATLLRPTSGDIRVFGHHVVHQSQDVRRCISLTGQFASLDKELTGRENMRMLTRLYGYPRSRSFQRTDELLEAFGLLDAGDRQLKHYSGGMHRRLDIAASLVVKPRLICLDEPTTGLDPRSRNMVWKVVRQLAESGTTVLLTTQYLEEADQLSDRIAVIDRGRIIAEGTNASLKRAFGGEKLYIRLAGPQHRDPAVKLLSGYIPGKVHKESDPCDISCDIPDITSGHKMLGMLLQEQIPLEEFSFKHPTLDDVFLELTKEDPQQI